MPGPQPSENRRRRNVPEKEKQQVVLPPEGRKGRAPACPTSVELSAKSKEQWKAWWSSPMATMWDERFDVFPLARCLELYDRQRSSADGLSNGELTEIRHIEARFGLDPRSRRELCWVIGEPEVGSDDGGPSKAEKDELAERRRRAAEAASAV